MRQTLNDDLPISEALFACMLRLAPSEVGEFASGLGDNKRAQLALFCYTRAHLRDVGLMIARECSGASLSREGGHAGAFLFEQAKSGVAEPTFGPARRSAVSLSRPVRAVQASPAHPLSA